MGKRWVVTEAIINLFIQNLSLVTNSGMLDVFEEALRDQGLFRAVLLTSSVCLLILLHLHHHHQRRRIKPLSHHRILSAAVGERWWSPPSLLGPALSSQLSRAPLSVLPAAPRGTTLPCPALLALPKRLMPLPPVQAVLGEGKCSHHQLQPPSLPRQLQPLSSPCQPQPLLSFSHQLKPLSSHRRHLSFLSLRAGTSMASIRVS